MPSMTKAGYTPPGAPKKPAPKPTGKPANSKKKRKKKRGMSAVTAISLVFFFVACLLGAGTIYVYVYTAPYANAFLPGTMLLGYPLGGAALDDAYALLGKVTAEDIGGFSVELTWDSQSYVLSAQDAALAVDADATLSPLWQRGRSGGMISRFVEMKRLEREPMIVQPIVTYDMAAADELLALIEQDIACQPEEAQVEYVPGSAEPFVFTPETIGYSLDLTGVRRQVESALASVEPAMIALAPEIVYPKVTLEDLEGAIVLRSRVLTPVAGGEETLANVSLAAQSFAGLRIEPGERLSFNETVGLRSAERGYLSAPEPAYGEGVSGTGGGVCQLSSALYRLALLGGLSVDERSAAVYPVDYCEMGQEAAVSDQGIDLVIRNTTVYPLFLNARVYEQDGAMMLDLQLIGEPLEGRYALVSGILEETLIEEPVYVRDHEGRYAQYIDERIEVGGAKPGYTVAVDRVTLDAQGEETDRETMTTDTYDAIPPAIYVGVNTR